MPAEEIEGPPGARLSHDRFTGLDSELNTNPTKRSLPKHTESQSQMTTQDKRAWRAWQLSWASLYALVLVEVGMTVALALLDYYSRKEHGFVRISPASNASFFDLGSLQGRPFLWTSIPTLVMTLFGLAWASVLNSYAQEMPFRALQEHEGSTLKRTVLLDYRRYPLFYNWFVAWKNRHILLGFCMLSSLVVAVVLVPIASRLFQLTNPTFTSQVSLPLASEYNGSTEILQVDYVPILGTVSAVKVYNGLWPAWTDGLYAITTFGLPQELTNANVTLVELDTTAYAAKLNCKSVTDYTISRSPSNGDSAILRITAADRGCDIVLSGSVGGSSRNFLTTVATDDCPATAGFSRIAFYAGSYSAGAPYLLDNLTVVSCIPSYHQTRATVLATAALRPISIQAEQTLTDARPQHWRLFEGDMIAVSTLDSMSPDYATQFGQLVLDTASRSYPQSFLSSTALLDSASAAFSSVFAVFAATQLFQPLSTPSHGRGSVATSETRLATVAWSTYTSIAILVVLIVLTVSVARVVHQKAPCFQEEPQGVLGAASLLHGSNLGEYIREAHLNQNGRIYEWLDSTFSLGAEVCRMRPGNVVHVEGLIYKQETEQSLLRHSKEQNEA
ncbi:hypothetical protein LTR37_001383 [Vermiconidia calcicola]|uniref:Uncharacterized protein n=1 Tax=Vermiconidia calcicola TaxID=1690605 RepID=A0ACC3NVK2_9PEZI|nr:hypothetical protein LTR37_001383 [Vermiconidia calcicola]